MAQILPSIFGADILHLKRDIDFLEKEGTAILHVDLMEDNYPTGLELENYSVAIPHGDPEYINSPFIVVIRLKETILMKKMEDPDQETPIRLFFVLGLQDGNGHLGILRQLIGQIQDQDFVEAILKASSAKDVYSVFSNYIKE